MSGIRPINGNILVKKIDGEVKVGGGLIIPDFVNIDSTIECQVIAVSDDYYNEKNELVQMNVSVGDIIITHSTFGVSIGSVYKLIREQDIVYVK